MDASVPADHAALQALQLRLGYRFEDGTLLQRALTHRSFGIDHNERLEYLGDALLDAVISSMLYRRHQDSDEGDLTRIRAHLVRQDTLHALAQPLQLASLVQLSDGEARNGGAVRASMQADVLEAIIGAVFLDGGYQAAESLVARLYGEKLTLHVADEAWAKDPKTALQEYLQARKLPTPDYQVSKTLGRHHDQTFEVICTAAERTAQGQGRSRRAAEQAAAAALLSILNGMSPVR